MQFGTSRGAPANILPSCMRHASCKSAMRSILFKQTFLLILTTRLQKTLLLSGLPWELFLKSSPKNQHFVLNSRFDLTTSDEMTLGGGLRWMCVCVWVGIPFWTKIIWESTTMAHLLLLASTQWWCVAPSACCCRHLQNNAFWYRSTFICRMWPCAYCVFVKNYHVEHSCPQCLGVIAICHWEEMSISIAVQ